jgi:poly(3-hydroxybutyrate) depolymerase
MEHRFVSLAGVVCALALTACGEPTTLSSSAAGGQGGTNGANGAGAGGSAGTTAGSAGTGGTSAVPGPGSVGCGATSWPAGDTRSNAILVDGTQRSYVVTIPEPYDPSHPHRLVFTFHRRGLRAEEVASGFAGSGYYGLAGLIGDDTILVSGQGLAAEGNALDTGWPNTDGRDIAYVRAVLDELNEAYCIDQSRIFATGMDDGANLSLAIGCQMSDLFRGIAPIAGTLPADPEAICMPGPLAVLQMHGMADDVVPIADAERARDVFLAANHCGTTTQTLATGPCVYYDGCDSGYPVVWCSHEDGHVIPSFASAYLALVFEQL